VSGRPFITAAVVKSLKTLNWVKREKAIVSNDLVSHQ